MNKEGNYEDEEERREKKKSPFLQFLRFWFFDCVIVFNFDYNKLITLIDVENDLI